MDSLCSLLFMRVKLAGKGLQSKDCKTTSFNLDHNLTTEGEVRHVMCVDVRKCQPQLDGCHIWSSLPGHQSSPTVTVLVGFYSFIKQRQQNNEGTNKSNVIRFGVLSKSLVSVLVWSISYPLVILVLPRYLQFLLNSYNL